jgi:hypothetical protein
MKDNNLMQRPTAEQVIQAIKASPLKFRRSWEQMRKETREPDDLARLLRTGLESGPACPMTEERWAKICGQP